MRFQTLALLLVALVASCSSSTTPAAGPPAPDVGVTPPAAPLPALGLNDVSVLVPIPASPAAPGALGPKDAGAKGKLLIQAVYDKVPEFGVVPAEGLDYARMRAVGIRFDGCFPKPAGCEPQIRIIMQPITDKGATLDSALHLFYKLTEEELAEIVPELRRLRTLAPEVKDAPLDVNQALAVQGLDGAYGTALRELVLKYAGDENLTRMTFFLRAPPVDFDEWFLGGFDRVNGQLVALDIVGVGKVNQMVRRTDVTDGYAYELVPSPKIPEDIEVLLTSDTAKAAAPAARTAALSSLARIQNPQKGGPDKLSCAGCHVSTFVRESTRAKHALDLATLPDAFKSSRDLSRAGGAATTVESLRAFGYFDKKAMIGDRVINESAAVVDDLEKRFPPPK